MNVMYMNHREFVERGVQHEPKLPAGFGENLAFRNQLSPQRGLGENLEAPIMLI